MKVSPYDIRYATVGHKRKDGKLVPAIITSGHPTREDAEAKKGDRDHVVGYVATYRQDYGAAYAETPRPMSVIDTFTFFTHTDYPGVAWCAPTYPPIFNQETGEDDGYDADWVVARMVGDDRDFTLERAECTPITRDEFCGECGQAGCGHS